ncbi:Gfo/Idh/MocA family oxidoreductase, partial [Streptomyces durbertensis]
PPMAVTEPPRPRHACVIGYGNAGRLHANVLSDLADTVTVIDPKHQHLPRTHRTFPHEVEDLPTSVAAGVDLWSICSPTASHLAVLKAVLHHNPAARILLEKPAVQGDQIDALTTLLTEHPAARLIVNDQYAHSTTLSDFTRLIAHLEPNAPINQITVTFTKDRGKDIAQGRFVDRTYGVLGYEWLHMLTVLSRLVPTAVMDTYLTGNPSDSELWATYDPRLFVSALTERTSLQSPDHDLLSLELSSSILGPSILLGRVPGPRSPWRQDIRPTDDRHRHVAVRAGDTLFTLHLEPVTAPDGWQLDRNHHSLTAIRAGQVLHDEVVRDSPLDTSIRNAATTLLADNPLAPPNLAPLRRIAALAETLRTRAPARAAYSRDRKAATSS